MTQPAGSSRHASDNGISAPLIDELVANFYGKVRQDALLGPVFSDLIGEDWAPHLKKVAAFWCYVTGLDRSYQAREFIPAHLRHSQIKASLLPRWLLLFRQAARDVCEKEAADRLIEIAERMAESIAISLARRETSIERSP